MTITQTRSQPDVLSKQLRQSSADFLLQATRDRRTFAARNEAWFYSYAIKVEERARELV
jgi:hypothetical protein